MGLSLCPSSRPLNLWDTPCPCPPAPVPGSLCLPGTWLSGSGMGKDIFSCWGRWPLQGLEPTGPHRIGHQGIGVGLLQPLESQDIQYINRNGYLGARMGLRGYLGSILSLTVSETGSECMQSNPNSLANREKAGGAIAGATYTKLLLEGSLGFWKIRHSFQFCFLGLMFKQKCTPR